MDNFVKGIISLTVAIIMFANVLMPQLKNTNTSEWTASEIALWAVTGLAGVIGILYGVFAIFGLV